MAAQDIRFADGAAYERSMGTWSALAGDVFLDWLAPPPGLRWIDVGCGNGAFTELLMGRCAPAEVQGVDSSPGQVEYARSRPGARGAAFRTGDAMALPFEAGRFDTAVMALVIFFVPDPAGGVAEMARVVRPGGLVAAYAWDILGGGFPREPIFAEIRALGKSPLMPPHPEAARTDVLRALWEGAGLIEIEQREITVEQRFSSFDEFWAASTAMGTMQPMFDRFSPDEFRAFKKRVRARLSESADGTVTQAARANAIRGRVAPA